MGINVKFLGVVTTPFLACLKGIGVMISASHNPTEYNGIKIFDNNGFKIGDKKEEALKKLEVLVKELESGDVALSASLAALAERFADSYGV